MKDTILFVIKVSAMVLILAALTIGVDALRSGRMSGRSPDQRLLDGLRMHDREVIDAALADGASPNAAEDFCLHSALIIAASGGDSLSVRELLARGASIDARDRNGGTALAHAAYWGHARVVDELIRSGASIDAPDDEGQTPLARALILGQPPVVQLLLKHGAAPDVADFEGTTPLMLAAESPRPEALIRLLLEAGADPTPAGAAARLGGKNGAGILP
jgi:ankyrin repeat protein